MAENIKKQQLLKMLSEANSIEKFRAIADWLVHTFPTAYFHMLKKPYCDKLLRTTIEQTSFLPKDSNNQSRLWHFINNKTEQCKCNICGKELNNLVPLDTKQNHYCSNRCAQKAPENQQKIKDTKAKNHTSTKDLVARQKQRLLEKYGVESTFQLAAVKQKIKQTMLKHYGVDHQMKAKEVRDKIAQTNIDRYGVSCTFASKAVQDKIKAKNQQKLGVDFPMQSKAIRDKMHENTGNTIKRKFFNDCLAKDKNIQPLFSAEEYVSNKDKFKQFKWKCRKCGNIFESRLIWGNAELVRCLKCNPIVYGTSGFEKDIAKSLEEALPDNYQVLNRTIENNTLIGPQQIDIIVKKDGIIKLLVEADGLYWHSEANKKDQQYHLAKTDLCQSKGHQLIHVFEDEWKLHKDIVLSRLLSLLGIYSNKIFARKCVCKETSSLEAKRFLSENHIQGNCHSRARYGLYSNDQLVALMTFGSRRNALGAKSEEGNWELLRYCCKKDVQVVGAAGKLLSTFEKEHKPQQLVSYADRRWSKGSLYSALGFMFDHASKPNYWYLDSRCQKRFYRFSFRKSILPKILDKFDENKTEQQNMLANGWHIIWDCGNLVYKKQYC